MELQRWRYLPLQVLQSPHFLVEASSGIRNVGKKIKYSQETKIFGELLIGLWDSKKTEAGILNYDVFLCFNVLSLYSIKSSTTHIAKSMRIMPLPHVLSYDRWCVLAHIIDDF